MGAAERVLARFKRAGGSDFSNFVPKADPKQAFQHAVDEARHESGHGSYSGTIAEKDGFSIRRHEPMTMEEANQFINSDLDKNDKWGPAFAVPIAESAKSAEKQFKVRVPARDESVARTEAAQVVREKFGSPGTGITLKDVKVALVKEGKLPELTLEKGGEEGFKVIGLGSRVLRDGWREGKAFTSRAEAVAAFKELVLKAKPPTGTKYEIVKFKTTDTFVIGDTTKSMHLFEVEGTVLTTKSTGKILGWLFYGIASS